MINDIRKWNVLGLTQSPNDTHLASIFEYTLRYKICSGEEKNLTQSIGSPEGSFIIAVELLVGIESNHTHLLLGNTHFPLLRRQEFYFHFSSTPEWSTSNNCSYIYWVTLSLSPNFCQPHGVLEETHGLVSTLSGTLTVITFLHKVDKEKRYRTWYLNRNRMRSTWASFLSVVLAESSTHHKHSTFVWQDYLIFKMTFFVGRKFIFIS